MNIDLYDTDTKLFQKMIQRNLKRFEQNSFIRGWFSTGFKAKSKAHKVDNAFYCYSSGNLKTRRGPWIEIYVDKCTTLSEREWREWNDAYRTIEYN